MDVAVAYRAPERLKVGGRNPFQPAPNTRLVRGGPNYVPQWVRRDSPFRSVADLRGRRVTGVYSAHLAVWPLEEAQARPLAGSCAVGVAGCTLGRCQTALPGRATEEVPI